MSQILLLNLLLKVNSTTFFILICLSKNEVFFDMLEA